MYRRLAGAGLAVGVALLLGLGFIVSGDPLFTTVGVLLVILGLMGLMPVVWPFLTRQPP